MATKRTSASVLAGAILAIGVAVFFAARAGPQREVELESRSTTAQPAPDASSSPVIAPAAPTEGAGNPQRSQAAETGLEILVLDPSSAPLPEAILLLFRGEEVLEKASTSANGVARFTPREGTGGYLLATMGRPTERGEIELSAGRRTLQLVEGGVVAGTVIVDGAAPTPAMELSWIQEDSRDPLKELPKSIRSAWYAAKGKAGVIAALTNADGTFALHGMPEQGPGFIRWSEPYFPEGATPENDEREFAVPVPRADLALSLVAGLQLKLRVVDSAGAALPSAAVELSLEKNADKGSHSSLTSSSGKDGRFVYSFLPGTLDKLVVKVATRERVGARSYEFLPPAGHPGVWDLGDLATAGTREVSVLVRDTDQRAIEGARVSAAAVPLGQSRSRTNSEGSVKLAVGAEETSISVGAVGFSSVQAPIPASGELTVTLTRACMLVLELPDAPGKSQGLAIEVKGPAPLFASEDTSSRTEANGWMSNTNGGITTFTSTTNETNRWKISGLLPGVALQAKLRGGAKELCTVEVPPLAVGEWRTVELHADEVAKSLRVRVLSPSREPIPRAKVSLVVRSGNTTSSRSTEADEKGEVELHDLYGEDCTIFAEAKDCAGKLIELRPIPDSTFEIVLEPAHKIEIELVRRDGSLVLEPAQVFVESVWPPLERAQELGQGRYRLECSPTGQVQVTVHASAGSVSRLIDASLPFVRIVVGESSILTVTVPRIGEKEVADWRIGVAEVGAKSDMSRAKLQWAVKGGAVTGINGLLPGKYDVWLENSSGAASDDWVRTGEPTPVTITADQLTVKIEL